MSENRFALIIGSTIYEDPDLRQLVAPTNDAAALACVLEDPEIGDFEVQQLLDEPYYRVKEAIDGFFSDRKRDDLLLLYFSGHGIKDDDGRLYFAMSNTKLTRKHSTAVAADFVNQLMTRTRPSQQILILDCCYSGAFSRGMLFKADRTIHTREHFEGRGRVVLTASDAMQYAFEGQKVQGEGVRSVFTSVLVRGLETGEADLNRDGAISLDELYDYVYDRITDKMPQQRPRKWAFDVQGDIIIAKNRSLAEEQRKRAEEERKRVEAQQRSLIEDRNRKILTQPELEVARLIAQGLTNAEIANKLSVAQKMVSYLRTRALDKIAAMGYPRNTGGLERYITDNRRDPE